MSGYQIRLRGYPQSSVEIDERRIAADHVLGTDRFVLSAINLHQCTQTDAAQLHVLVHTFHTFITLKTRLQPPSYFFKPVAFERTEL